jgi:hypothetical protein
MPSAIKTETMARAVRDCGAGLGARTGGVGESAARGAARWLFVPQ